MVYVSRDTQDKISGVFSRKQPGTAEEQLSEDHPDVIAYRAGTPPPTDEEVIREKAQSDPVFRQQIRERAKRMGKPPSAILQEIIDA